MFKNKYIGLWLLLALSLVIIIVLAFSNDIKIGSYTFKKAPFAETLNLNDNDSIQSLDSISKSSDATDKNKKAELDTLPQSFLIFGDSMTYNLALRLAKYAKQNGHEIHAVNWDSSGSKTWGDCDTLAYYINLYKPTHVFISLGSNELGMSKPSSRIPYIKNILSVIGDIPYVWIGPPNWTKDTGINDVIASQCKPGSFFLSDGMSFERGPDKRHPTARSSALWMDSIIRWLPKSSHPFIAELPSDSLNKVKVSPNIVFLKQKK